MAGRHARDYYGASAPPSAPADDAPARSRTGCSREGTRTVPTFTDDRSSGEAPSSAPRHRHGYAADFHHGLPPNRPARSSRPASPPAVRTATQPISARLELVGLEGLDTLVSHVHLPVSLAGPAPSGSTGSSRRCQGCLPPSPASPGSGCPQLHPAATTAGGGGLSPPLGHAAPRGARSRPPTGRRSPRRTDSRWEKVRCSVFQASVNFVTTDADNPAVEPRNWPSAGTKSPLDNPCR